MQGIPVLPNGDPVRVTRVIAGNYTQFANWCMFSQVNPRSWMVKYVHTEFDMRGLPDFDIVYTGTCWDRRDIDRILHTVVYLRSVRALKNDYEQYESADIEPNVVSRYPGQTDD